MYIEPENEYDKAHNEAVRLQMEAERKLLQALSATSKKFTKLFSDHNNCFAYYYTGILNNTYIVLGLN